MTHETIFCENVEKRKSKSIRKIKYDSSILVLQQPEIRVISSYFFGLCSCADRSYHISKFEISIEWMWSVNEELLVYNMTMINDVHEK